jgi:hypothetical protein
MTNVFHYTKGYNITAILQSGEIKREGDAGAYVGLATSSANIWQTERQVWLTTEMEIPFTACPCIGRRVGVNEFALYQREPNRGYKKWAHLAKGAFRFSFSAEEIDAVKYVNGKVQSQLEKNGMREVFELVAELGNDDIQQWYHTNRAVSLTKCIGVEMWKRDYGWKHVTMDFLKLQYAA